jgi:hypothetical protein
MEAWGLLLVGFNFRQHGAGHKACRFGVFFRI